MEAPEKIYLQLDGDGGNEYIENAATWCQDRIYDSDVEYRRVDTLSQKPEPAWQPIETAPKDRIIILADDNGAVFPGWWTGDEAYPWAFVDTEETQWWDDFCCANAPQDLICPNGMPEKHVTHWMPFPAPPKED